MIIIKIKAGLGNQMFQYAFGRAMSLRNNVVFKLDLSEWLDGSARKDRPYELNNFKIIENIASETEVLNTRYPYGLISKIIAKIKRRIGVDNIKFNSNLLKIDKDIYLDGYWQDERYFIDYKEQIYNDFRLKNPPKEKVRILQEKIRNDNMPVSIHIRRGDNAYNPSSIKAFGCPNIKYYTDAIRMIKDEIIKDNNIVNINLYVFSDDIEWVKENLKTDIPQIIVSGQGIDTFEELILMSKCKHNIISNSTFSWWGAWLNQNKDKIVIAPKRWVLKNQRMFRDIVPKDWIRI